MHTTDKEKKKRLWGFPTDRIIDFQVAALMCTQNTFASWGMLFNW